MVEFHGWFTLRHSPADIDPDETAQIAREVSSRLAEFANDRIAGIQANNGTYVIWLAGCPNRWTSEIDKVFDLLRFICQRAPGSYGLLYLWDDESKHSNEFRVWRIALGKLTEHRDELLSPCVPTIESPLTPDGN